MAKKPTKPSKKYVKPKVVKHGSLKGLSERVTGSKKDTEP
jgi:hypothetical protein